MFPINRVVALATPVFSAVAAVGSAWAAKHFPGLPTPSTGQLLGVELAGATAATGAALKWLHGHQKYEARLAALEHEAMTVIGTVTDDTEKASQPAALTATPVDPEATAKAKAELVRLEGLLADARNAVEGLPAAKAPAAAATSATAAQASS
ncbi:MAG: hypothetical protein WAU42_04050 [Solirubrobacteraceae bacterium]